MNRVAVSLHGLTKSLWNKEVLIRTNAGTFGEDECSARIGSKELTAGTYRVYERVGDGRWRLEGCDPGRAPGLMLCLNRKRIDGLRAKLRRLAKKIEALAILN